MPTAVEDIKEEVVKYMGEAKEGVLDLVDTAKDGLEEGLDKAKELLESEEKAKLRRETFENTDRMERFKERKFLLVVITMMQVMNVTLLFLITYPETIIILLMLGLLVFSGDKTPAIAAEGEEAMDWQRILLDLVGVASIPLLTWAVYPNKGSWDGVKRLYCTVLVVYS